MSFLQEIKEIITSLNIDVETGIHSEKIASDEYAVIVPLTEEYELYADNKPIDDIREARISIFSKGNYQATKIRLIAAFLSNDFIITERRYIGCETDTGYHHFVIDILRHYNLED